MPAIKEGVCYRIWAGDSVVYGPAELSLLANWIKEDRLTTQTWVFSEMDDSWRKADQVPELQMFFRLKSDGAAAAVIGQAPKPPAGTEMAPRALRRLDVFSAMSDEQLIRFRAYLQPQTVRRWAAIIQQGDPGDAMYFLVEGEVRVRMMINGQESVLATLSAGDFFGEISLFDHGPRSADVIANADCLLLKISVVSFQLLAAEAPDLTTPFLVAMGKTLTSRIRADNKRFRELVGFAQITGH